MLAHAPALVFFLCCLAAPAQRVVLAGGTSGITPPVDWTVIRASDLDSDRRVSDPSDARALAVLRSTIDTIQKHGHSNEHTLFHQPGGSDGSIRIVNANSVGLSATSAELLTTTNANSMRTAYESALRDSGQEVQFLDHATMQLFAVPSLVLHFRSTGNGATWRLDQHCVPSGERLQYLETLHLEDDAGAAAAIEALLRTFDGAAEGAADPILRNMLIAGAAAALAGVLTAVRGVRRRQRTAAAMGSSR